MPILNLAEEIARHLPSTEARDVGVGAGVGRLVGGGAAGAVVGGLLGGLLGNEWGVTGAFAGQEFAIGVIAHSLKVAYSLKRFDFYIKLDQVFWRYRNLGALYE